MLCYERMVVHTKGVYHHLPRLRLMRFKTNLHWNKWSAFKGTWSPDENAWMLEDWQHARSLFGCLNWKKSLCGFGEAMAKKETQFLGPEARLLAMFN